MHTTRKVIRATLIGTMVAGVMSLSCAAGVAPIAVHAAATSPTITAYEVNHYPFSVNALGTGFTPGGSVHVELDVAPYDFATGVPGVLRTAASANTSAARTTYVSNGHGVLFPRVGGYFTVNIGLSPAVCNAFDFAYTLVATDVATGTTISSPEVFSYCD